MRASCAEPVIVAALLRVSALARLLLRLAEEAV